MKSTNPTTSFLSLIQSELESEKISKKSIAFSQDSPFFAKTIDEYTQEIEKFDDFIHVILQLIKKFCNDLKSIANCGEALSIHMQAGFNKSLASKNKTIIPILGLFGEVISDIATSQEVMAESLFNTFVIPLENFYQKSVHNIVEFKKQYVKERNVQDDTIVRYLQSDVMKRNPQSNQVEFRAMEVVSHRRDLELLRFDLVRLINELEMKKSFELGEMCVTSMVTMKEHYNEFNQRISSYTQYTNELLDQQSVHRELFEKEHMSNMKLRSDMDAILETMIERVNNQLPQESTDSTSSSTGTTSTFVSSLSAPENIFLPSATSSTSTSSNNDEINLSNVMSKMSTWIGIGRKNNMDHLDTVYQTRNSSFTPSNANNGRSRSASNSLPPNSSPSQTATSLNVNTNTNSNSNTNTNSSPSLLGSLNGLSVNDTEMRMKALDLCELEYYYIYNPLEAFSGVIKQGYILEKTTTKLMQQVSWVRRWLVLDETKLYLIKEGNSLSSPLEVQIVCDVILSTVKELKHAEVPYVFEIVYGNIKAFTFQAEGAKDYNLWIDAIRDAIEKRLISGPSNVPYNNTPSLSTSSQAVSNSSRSSKKREYVVDILRNNSYCAECFRSKPIPDWVSLNLGCVICIDCSGIHRSIGVHLSKVRSLTLDDLESIEYEILTRLGNDINHRMWEELLDFDENGVKTNINHSITKPNDKSDYSTREQFIRAKYQSKQFVNVVDITIEDYLRFLQACQEDDISLVYKYIVLGIPLNGWKEVNDDFHKLIAERRISFSKPLHIACKFGSISCVALLVLNGADIFTSLEDHDKLIQNSSENNDIEGPISLQIANIFHHKDIIKYLNRKIDLLGGSHPVNSTNRSSSPNQSSGIEIDDIPAVDFLSVATSDTLSNSHSSALNSTSNSTRSGNSPSLSIIGDKFVSASESSTKAGKVLEKMKQDKDKLTQGFKKVLNI